MNFANLFPWRKPKPVESKSPAAARTERVVIKPSRPLKVGSWVMSPDGVGIVVALDSSSAFVALVAADGVTTHTLQFSQTQLRKAQRSEIPSSRGGTA